MLPKIEVVETAKDLFFIFQNADIIGKELKVNGDFAKEEKECCINLLKNTTDVIVLDIGANIGTFSVGIAKHFNDRNVEVVAFEPQRVVFHQLCANIFLNRLENIRAINMAIGEENKLIEIPILDFNMSSNPGGFTIDESIREKLNVEMNLGRTATNTYLNEKKEQVQVVRIDDLKFDKKIGFIKIDVEGYERECIQGAIETITKNDFPPIVFEDWGNKFDWYKDKSDDTVNLLKSLGYKIAKLAGRNFIATHEINHAGNRE